MNKFLQKLAKIFLGLSMAAGVGVAIGAGRKDASPVHASETTFTCGTDTSSSMTLTKDGISLAFQTSGGTWNRTDNYRLYANKKLTVSSSSTITKIEFTISQGTMTLNSGGGSYSSGTWTGSSTSIVFACTSQVRFTPVKVTYGSTSTTYTVSYNPVSSSGTGSGTITDSNSPYNSGAQVTVLDSTGFTAPSGKEFSHWHTTPTGTGGTSYNPGDKFTINTNTTLYAQWDDPSQATGNVTIAYSAGTTTNMTGGNDAATLGVSATDWSVVGYKGGNQNYPGLNQNNNIRLYYNATKSNYISVKTLVANRTIEKIVLETGNSTNFAVYAGDQTTSGTAITGVNGRYTFSSGVTAFTIYNTNTSNVQVYIYSIKVYYIDPPVTYSVTYDGNGKTSGSVPTDNTAYSSGDTVTVKPNSGNLEKTGYTFGGWNTLANGTGTNYAAGTGTFEISDNTTLYAKWNANTYTITYKDEGDVAFSGNHESGYPQSHTYGTATTLKSATKTGYTFSGWYTTSSCTGSAVTSLSATGYTAAITLYAKWTINTYNISLVSGSHGSLSGNTTVNYNTALSITLVADQGYALPDSLNGVEMDGNDISGSVTYDSSTGAITGPNVTGAVVIDAVCTMVATPYSITVNIDHDGTYSGDSIITNMGGTASVTVQAGSGYKLPDSISVTGATSVYTKSSKYEATIALSNATAAVSITIECVALTPYSIDYSGVQNASYTGASSILEDGNISIVFSPDTENGYYQPESSGVGVTGATKVSWVKATGTLTISNPTGNVTISYTPVKDTLTSISLSVIERDYVLGEAFVMPVVTATYSETGNKTVTGATYSGYDAYTISNQTVTISYNDGSLVDPVTATYTAHVKARVLPTTITWEKVTDSSDLAVEDEIVIVASASDYALSTTQNGNNRGRTAVTKSSNVVSWTGESVQVLTLEEGSSTGTFALSTGDGYLYAASSSKNYLRTKATIDGDASFTIAISNGDATIQSQGDNTHNLLKYNTNDGVFSCYASGQAAVCVYKKHSETTGTPTLIKIDATYVSETKSVGSSISTSDFSVDLLYDTGDTDTITSGFTISPSTLSSTSNDITVSYGGFDDVVTVSAVNATVSSVVLVETGNVKKSGYIDWAGATWDLTNLTVRVTWSNSNVDDYSLAELVAEEHATISHAKPVTGDTSYTVSYSYNGVALTNNTVTLTQAVVADSVSSISWTKVSASHFTAYAGDQLTAETVGEWDVIPTWAGKGEAAEISFGEFTLKIGTKTVNSLPYTWAAEDDGKEVKVVYGGIERGNSAAHANIVAKLNSIDHSYETTGQQTIVLDVANATFSPSGTSGTGSQTTGTINGFTIDTDKGYFDVGNHLRVYSGGSFSISNSSVLINEISYSFTGGKTGLDSVTELSTNTYETTAHDQARITAITIKFTGPMSHTDHYANQVGQYDVQRAVIDFAQEFVDRFEGGGEYQAVCTSYGETDTAKILEMWGEISDEFGYRFNDDDLGFDSDQKTFAKNMFKYASSIDQNVDANADILQHMLAKYDYIYAHYGEALELDDFLNESAGRVAVSSSQHISPLIIIAKNTNSVAIIVIISMVSVTAIGGYFFLRKRKENI